MNKKTFIMSLVLLLFSFTVSYSQSILSGSVVDSTLNEPLIGAYVIIEGTSFGARTDVNGQYIIVSIHPEGTYKVRVSYIGYADKEYQVNFIKGRKQVLDIHLNPNVKMGCGFIIYKKAEPDSISK